MGRLMKIGQLDSEDCLARSSVPPGLAGISSEAFCRLGLSVLGQSAMACCVSAKSQFHRMSDRWLPRTEDR